VELILRVERAPISMIFRNSQVIKDAVDSALAHGLTVVAAAGNEADDIGFPARYAPVLAVGATDAQGHVSSFSGRGPDLDVVAPGENVDVVGSAGKISRVKGTSYSAALVSGVEALRLGRGRTRVRARDLGFPAQEQGIGLIDAVLSAQ
jgi:hypothetical protein